MFSKGGFTLAVLHVGAPACGMNAAVRSFVRNVLFRGDSVVCVHDGIEGLVKGLINPLTWSDVAGWVSQGGANLGTNRTLPSAETIPLIDLQLKKFGINGLLIVGGFEAYHSILIMTDSRDKFSGFRIPMMCIPATISKLMNSKKENLRII